MEVYAGEQYQSQFSFILEIHVSLSINERMFFTNSLVIFILYISIVK